MKFWKKALLTIAALTVGTSAGITSVSAASSAVNSELVHKGELTIGLEGTYSPYSYRKNNKLTGFEVDLGKAVAKKMGLKAKFVPTKWDSLIAGLGSGKFDVVMNNITQTPERAKQFKKYKGNLTPNGDFTSSLDMIKQGRAAGTVNSREAWYAYSKKNSTKGLKMIDVSSEQDPAKISALFNKKDTAIQSSYNKALKELQQDGTVKKLSEKYFGTDITE